MIRSSFFISISLCCTIVLQIFSITESHEARVVVVVVIDQLASATFKRIEPHLRYGLKRLSEHGIIYENAFHPHATPATATGHTAFNTGTYAQDHGIIGNEWINPMNGNIIVSDDDKDPSARAIAPNNKRYDYGRSAKNCMVDGISDQIILARQPFAPHDCWALSYKSRAATACAGHLGKAIWFDTISGDFTSSGAYFEQLPDWIVQFNKNHNFHKKKKLFWERAYPNMPGLYNFAHAQDYRFAACGEPLVDCPVQFKENYGAVAKTPYGIKHLFNLGLACVEQHFKKCKKNKKGKLLLWISISGTDKIGHIYGRDSDEVTDMLYHVDQELGRFMRKLTRYVNPKRTLFVLSADHGVAPIPELVKEEGMPRVNRISPKSFIKKCNDTIYTKTGIETCIIGFQTPSFIINESILNTLNDKDRIHVYQLIKENLLAVPGIKKVWSYEELAHCACPHSEIELNFCKQLYPGRSGQIIVQTDPYTEITGYPTGTTHRSPYNYDTHVPLIIYQHATHSHRKIIDKVLTIQLANTLAYILGIPEPSSSMCPMLPGVVNNCSSLCY